MRLPLMPRREGDGARSRAHTKWCGVCVRPHIRNDANGSSSRSIRRRGASHRCVGGHALLRSGGRPRLGRHAPPTRQRVNATGATGKDPDDPGAPPEGTRGARTTERHHSLTPVVDCMFASMQKRPQCFADPGFAGTLRCFRAPEPCRENHNNRSSGGCGSEPRAYVDS